ncbi:sensor histidine kinase YycG [Oxobacter pfennigii]|uniref:histidine kinase n=1 Tax=Oxobacter pfennigii TaxID=36849 RepID=A0A0P8W680_9CLOT|nr:HAMP domain-containing sensor histidine kinase [Oxobacter pfennigii]KPU44198.1 sensor histidine kinase YycG [Oxobacter pfennigii]
MKIRTKLLVTFLSTIILPFILTFSLFSMYLSYKTKDAKFDSTDINEYTTELTDKISAHYESINNYDLFDRQIRQELSSLSSIIESIEIIDLKGKILYNSKASDRIGKSLDLNQLTYHTNDIFSTMEWDSDFYLRIIKPMVYEDSVKGFVLFEQNTVWMIEYAKEITYPVLWFGIGSIILFIVFFSGLISRGIISPLNELSYATEQIANGNLDFKIKYKKSDEIGILCQAFETMRNKLKESLIKQTEYEYSRKELVASISHDLRTPLTSIKGYVEALKDGIITDPDKVSKYLEVIYSKTESMNKLLDDLFEYSRLDLNNIRMNMKVTESRGMLKEIIENLRYDIEKEGIIFNTSIEFQCLYVYVDKLRIDEVINNIIQNALRYTKTSIVFNAFRKDNSLIVSIKDDGCGISENEKEHIFERFYRSEKSRTSKMGGTGLGLAIAKKIIEEHAGKIWVESDGLNGSTFYFSIPEKNKP